MRERESVSYVWPYGASELWRRESDAIVALNPKPETLNPKTICGGRWTRTTLILNPKPSTLNPKP